MATRIASTAKPERVYAFPAPVVSFVVEANAAPSAGWSVTVSGVSFARLDGTMSVTIGGQPCGTLSWASGTSAVCLASGGDGVQKTVTATVSGVVGTRSQSFSFDGTAGLWSECSAWQGQCVCWALAIVAARPLPLQCGHNVFALHCVCGCRVSRPRLQRPRSASSRSRTCLARRASA